MSARIASRSVALIAHFVAALVAPLIVSAGVVVTASASGATSVPRCTRASHLVVSPHGIDGAGGWSLFGVLFTNGSSLKCSLVMPSAQAVVGVERTPVGPPALDEQGKGYVRPTVLKAHESMFIWYAVANVENFTRSQCMPTYANGVVLGLHGLGTWYLPVARPGFTKICTSRASTSVTFVAVLH